MNTNYKFYLEVEFPDGERKATSFEIESMVADPRLKPYDRCDDSITACLSGGVTCKTAGLIDVSRKKIAEKIAVKLTDEILQAIKARDLRNGYKQETFAGI
ncbi:MAG: hypothetical protein M0R32_11050 [Candidatus Cloacimonetes bacterium]|jgi:hypothetical protein|nr:hypothetical protein [Candidatus Cloacimonadota bacterium]